MEIGMFKVSAKPERSSRAAHTTKQKLRHTLHQLLKDKWWGKLCPALGVNERQNWSNQEWMSLIITMVNNPFCSLSPSVIHFKWKAGNLEPEETEVYPELEEKKIHSHSSPLLEWKWILNTALMTSVVKRENLNSSTAFIIARIRLFSLLLEKDILK